MPVPALPAVSTADDAYGRRVPTQQRSRARMTGVLDAAAALIDEIGPDAITTSLIASRAGVSVGWLYDFFPNRQAVYEAVMARSIANVTPIADRVHEEFADRPWSDGLCAVIDALVSFYRTDPGFRVLWFSRFQSAQMIQENVSHDLAEARAALSRLERSGLRLRGVDPDAAMHLVVGIVDKGLDLAFRLDPSGDPRIIDETKAAVCAYLERYDEPTPSAPVGAPKSRRKWSSEPPPSVPNARR